MWMCGFYRFIAVALLCLSFQFYFNFSTARSPEPRCACLAGWLAGSVAFCRHFYFQLGSNKCARALATLAPQSVAATSLAHQPNNEKDKQSAIMPKFVFIFVALANTHTHKHTHALIDADTDRRTHSLYVIAGRAIWHWLKCICYVARPLLLLLQLFVVLVIVVYSGTTTNYLNYYSGGSQIRQLRPSLYYRRQSIAHRYRCSRWLHVTLSS